MQRYPRKPALIVLLIAGILGGVYALAWGRIEAYLKNRHGGATIEAIEKTIREGKATPETWISYGDALSDKGEFGRAVEAFKEALTLDPARREAKFRLGLCLAQAGRADDLYKNLSDLVYRSEAKVAVQLFERAEVQKYLTEERFANLSREASGQAMD